MVGDGEDTMHAKLLNTAFTTAILVFGAACGKGGLADLNDGDMKMPEGMNMPNPELAKVIKIEVDPSTLDLVADARVQITVTGLKDDGTSIDITKVILNKI